MPSISLFGRSGRIIEGLPPSIYRSAAVASADEIAAALDDFSARCNANGSLRKMLRTWCRVIHFCAADTGDVFTVRIDFGEITSVTLGAGDVADLMVTAGSEDLCDLFWGDLNPAQKYLSGEIVVRGEAADVLRIDAMSSLMWQG